MYDSFLGVQSVREGLTEVVMCKMKQGLHCGEPVCCGENYIRMSTNPPTDLKFYASIFKTLASLYCRE